MRVPWELNPWSFALLTQCSTTEPQEHLELMKVKNQYLKILEYLHLSLYNFIYIYIFI